jgi:SAM-dependent methyltransferase
LAKPAVPARISWAVERLGLHGNETILEVGCGGGVAAALIGARLATCRLVAIDRSVTATSAALGRPENRARLAVGKLEIVTAALADLAGHEAVFDIVFAINVNVFWLDPKHEMQVIRRVLKPGGRLALFYEPPTLGRAREAAGLLKEKLAEHGFEANVTAFDEGAKLLHVEARLRD